VGTRRHSGQRGASLLLLFGIIKTNTNKDYYVVHRRRTAILTHSEVLRKEREKEEERLAAELEAEVKKQQRKETTEHNKKMRAIKSSSDIMLGIRRTGPNASIRLV
jgi:uncharacterized protein (DUF4415 family)